MVMCNFARMCCWKHAAAAENMLLESPPVTLAQPRTIRATHLLDCWTAERCVPDPMPCGRRVK